MIDSKKVQEHFDKAAARHSDNNAVLDSAAGDEVSFANVYRDYYSKRFISKYVTPGKQDSVLDFGCGVGRLSFFLSPYVKNIVGVDVSENMINVAKKNAVNYPNVRFEWLKEHQLLPAGPEQFNKVMLSWVMQHVSDEDCKKLFAEYYRVLKPGGKLFLFEQVKNSLQTAGGIQIFRTLERYHEMLAVTGFREVLTKRVMRVPARGMSLWNKFKINSRILLWSFSRLDDLIINRKPHLADYYTYCFVFEKK